MWGVDEDKLRYISHPWHLSDDVEGKMKKCKITWGCLSVVALLSLTLAVGCETKKSASTDKAAQKEIKKIVFDPKNPCNLLTKGEVEAVMKQEVKGPNPLDYACSYESIDSSKWSSLMFLLEHGDAAGLFEDMRQLLKKKGIEVKQIEGIGDGAYFSEETLFVLKGEYFFRFMSDGLKGYELTEEEIRSLAKAAIDKLP
jgi:hypothetical protein